MKWHFLLFINLFLLFSCKKYKQAEAAFFIKSPDVTVSTNKSTQGSGSNKITDLFLYVDGKFQGVYPVGNLMPVVTKNNRVTINLYAGIKNNGIGDTRVFYPFYEVLTLDTFVQSGITVTRPFAFKYGSATVFEWLEDFDSGTGFTIKKSATGSDVNFKLASPEDSYEGKSLEISLTGDSVQAELESTISHPLPRGKSELYLEIDYKCTALVDVGLLTDLNQHKSVLILNPKSTWNKIYINLANISNTAPVSDAYKVYFRMIKTADYPNPRLFLDNIKLVYF